MPSAERDAPKEGDKQLRHQHSASSDQGRSLVPMWDSSDPERAPPPLPLHPQSPTVSSRISTSSAIQSAHAALTERARESGVVSGALTKRTSEISPERSLIRGTHHRRMQSLQPGSVRDMSLLLEGGQQSSPSSPIKSPEKTPRPSTPCRARESQTETQSAENDSLAGQATPTPGASLTPIIRPTVRRPHHSILGENTPPQSATMLALQNTPAPTSREAESPLAIVTNSSTALVKVPQQFEGLSNQILSLTSIATALQRDMAQLSRRSRDNATDLLTLKEATNARDEDIRKSLRELINNAHEASSRTASRDPFGGGLFLDNKPHNPFPVSKAARPFSLPRIPSLNSFAASIDSDSMGTPSLFSQDAPATIAILEKILRDMGTKDGQDLLLSRLSEVVEKMAGMASASKVAELVRLVKDNSEQAIVAAPGGGGGNHSRPRNFSFDEHPRNLELDFDNRPQAGPMTQRVEKLLQDRDSRRSSAPPSRAAIELINDDVLKTIRTVKDSVAQGGGLTAEVKALVRELRGEVLGMGREIGRRLDEVVDKDTGGETIASKDEMAQIINEGLDQMKGHMDDVLREHRRQSTASASSRSNIIDYQEIYNALRAALRDSQASKSQADDLNREDIIVAVREAWENYKPELDNHTLGLEREEILDYIKEGLQTYSQHDDPVGATRDEVFQAVVEGLKHFVPPRMETTASLSRDEILDAVRECLEEFEFPVAPSAINADLTRDDMVHAVKEGLSAFDFDSKGPLIPRQLDNDELADRLHEIMDFLHAEFKAVSDEAKQNVAASGRDTEQVLDATKDGLEKLRSDIEEYISHIHAPTGQAEIIQGLVGSLDTFREEVASLVAHSSDLSRSAIEIQMESLRDTVNSSIVPITPSLDQKEILEAMKSGLDSLRAEMHRPLAGTTEVLDALHEGLADLHASMDKISNRPMDLTANDEILDALKAGLDGVRSDIDALREQSRGDKTIATLSDGAVVPADMLKHDDIKNLEVLITQLRIKVEAMEPGTESVSKVDLSRIEEMLQTVQESVEGIQPNRDSRASTDNASREDVQAIETILRNTKARLDDLIDGEQAVRKEHIDSVETLLLDTKDAIGTVTSQVEGLSRREDLATVESLVTQVAAGFEEMKERAFKELEDPERVTKSDLDAVEAVCLDIKTVFDQMVKTDLATLTTKDDIQRFDLILEDLKTKIEAQGETNSKAFDDRQAETVGVGERVSEVKVCLEEFQELVKGKLDDGATSIDALGKFLEGISETVSQNATISQDLKEMSDAMKVEFEESKAGVVGVKLEADEKFQQTTETIGAKIDERIAELMAKYDEFQIAMDDRIKAGEAHGAETEAAVLGTKAVAEELKTLIDTLGSAVTESMEKSEEASKTVFDRVEDLVARSDENHSEQKAEHVQTRQHIQLAVDGVQGLQGHVTEYQPKILEAVKDVLLIVGQHYEYSKTSTTDIQDKIEEAKPNAEPPLLPAVEKYDDTGVHEKLDRIVDHTHAAGKAFSQLETLDKVHQQVLQTAADISIFLAGQQMKIAHAEEDKEKALQETSVALERRLAEKDHVEASILSLRDEAQELTEVVRSLKSDQELLTRQKTKLTGDVSSLETALRLRREELHDMEARAEGLERRILEGVMDHSRVLLMSKSAKGQDTMSRKRVRVREPRQDTISTVKPVRPAVNLALSAKRNLIPPNPAGASRRILSLSQITGNVQSGGFNRSQSVRNPAGRAIRKGSWGGSLAKGYGDLDKENASLKESDEEGENPNRDQLRERVGPIEDSVADGDVSDTDTLRRSSRGTTVITGVTDDYTGTDVSYSDDEDMHSEWTESAVGSALGPEEEGNEIVLFEG